MTDQEIRLKFGEMTGQEFRTARAIVDYYERRLFRQNPNKQTGKKKRIDA